VHHQSTPLAPLAGAGDTGSDARSRRPLIALDGAARVSTMHAS